MLFVSVFLLVRNEKNFILFFFLSGLSGHDSKRRERVMNGTEDTFGTRKNR